MNSESLKEQLTRLLKRETPSFGLIPILRFLSYFYALILNLRNYCYDVGLLKTSKVNCPVISVGNITLGGTGKTPMVLFLCNYYKERGERIGVISRGYGAAKDEINGLNDEALLVKKHYPDAIVVCNKDRTLAAKQCISQGATLIIADDAYSHRRLHRDVDILMLDKELPWGFKHVLPAGFLREPLENINRASLIISQANSDQHINDDINNTLSQLNPNAKHLHTNKTLLSITHHHSAKALSLDGLSINMACAIANPSQFATFLESHGAKIDQSDTLPDHHQFSTDDLNRWKTLAKDKALLITEKDIVKIGPRLDPLDQVYVVKIALTIEGFTNPLDTKASQ